ncbi:hypothetical protein OHA70_08390 [Kribbella sp. NBC_00382]|uniref:bpX5 domain-containing protein n=1 Tax=Kribbella sp. NBC_00382 TaxID=2975967 RepID=UPI002E1CFD01
MPTGESVAEAQSGSGAQDVKPVEVVWSRREPPLEVVGVAAGGNVAELLREATVARLAEQRYRVVSGEGWLVVLGEELPWADGAIYLGWDSGVLVPTTVVPSPPVALLRSALPEGELVVLLPDRVLVADAPARAADPALLGG